MVLELVRRGSQSPTAPAVIALEGLDSATPSPSIYFPSTVWFPPLW